MDYKKLYCDYYKFILSRKPLIGDYIFNRFGCFLIVDVKEVNGCILYTLINVYQSNVHYKKLSFNSFISDENENFVCNESLLIDKKLIKLLIDNIDINNFNSIIVFLRRTFGFYDEDIFSIINFNFYMLYHLYAYINGIIFDKVDNMILSRFGIIKFIKKYKNTSLREVLIENGETWLVRKKKLKNCKRKEIYKNNKKNEKNKQYKIRKTVKYEFIKRLKEKEIIKYDTKLYKKLFFRFLKINKHYNLWLNTINNHKWKGINNYIFECIIPSRYIEFLFCKELEDNNPLKKEIIRLNLEWNVICYESNKDLFVDGLTCFLNSYNFNAYDLNYEFYYKVKENYNFLIKK